MKPSFRFVGEGPFVVLLHGTVPGAATFDPLIAPLSRLRRLVLVSLPGYDGTAPAPGPFEMTESIEALAVALTDAGVRTFDVVGSSSGAYRALALALRNDVEVRRVVSLGGYARLANDHREGLLGLAAASRSGADVASTAAQTMYSETYAAAHPEAVARIAEYLASMPKGAAESELEACARSADLLPALRTCRTPIVARIGDADRAMPRERTEEIAAAAPNARVEIVAGAGHALLEEDAEATVASVLRALA